MEQKKIPFSIDTPASSEVAYLGTPMQMYLEKTEREHHRSIMAWFLVLLLHLLVISSVVVLITVLSISYGVKIALGSFGVIMMLSLRIAVKRYDLACKEKKKCKKYIMAYIQREAGGKLSQSAEIGLQQFYEQNHDPPPKENMIIELLRLRNRRE
jgi:hypothetical protein